MVFAVVLVGFEVIRLRYEFRVNLFTFARGFPGKQTGVTADLPPLPADLDPPVHIC